MASAGYRLCRCVIGSILWGDPVWKGAAAVEQSASTAGGGRRMIQTQYPTQYNEEPCRYRWESRAITPRARQTRGECRVEIDKRLLQCTRTDSRGYGSIMRRINQPVGSRICSRLRSRSS
jgi:hypothetical protein